MTILALETSTEAFSIALEHSGQRYSHFEIAPRKHGDLLLPTVDRLLQEASCSIEDVKQVVYGCGPGAFTGVRIAVSAAQGLALGVDANLIGVSSLQNLALQAFEKTSANLAIVAMDARMGEVYFAVFRRSESESGMLFPELVTEQQVVAPESLSPMTVSDSESIVAIGSGWNEYGTQLRQTLSVSPEFSLFDLFPDANTAITLSKHSSLQCSAHQPEEAVPLYLRNNVAKKSQKPSILER